MHTDNPLFRKTLSKDMTDVLIRVGLIVFLAILCYKIFAPFMGLMLWALVLAVILYPLHQKLALKMGGKQGLSATVMVLIGLVLIGLPTILLSASVADWLHGIYETFSGKPVSIKPPPASVAEWPLIGNKAHDLWTQASQNLPALIHQIQPQLSGIGKTILSTVANTAGGVLQFLGSMIVAGIMMAYGDSGSEAMKRIICRLTTEEKGPKLHSLSTLTIRSVAMGVIGVAFIQALLVGIGFFWAGVPAAGILAVVVLLIGIVQIPALIVTLPVIGYIWAGMDGSTTHNAVVTVYIIVAGMADGFIKPLLLGRGVDIPMPVVLLGALGGMVTAGMIGLFLGAVLLALGYQIFMEWVGDTDEVDADPDPDIADETVPATD